MQVDAATKRDQFQTDIPLAKVVKRPLKMAKLQKNSLFSKRIVWIFVAFVENNATMSSIGYFESYVSCFVQNRRK